MPPVTVFVAAAAFTVAIAWATPGVACKIALEPPNFEFSAKGERVGAPPAPPLLKRVLVRRSSRPPPGPGDCSEIGGFALVLVLSDPDTELQQLGVGLKVIRGKLPQGMTLTGGPYAHENGTLNFGFADYPDEEFSFTLAAKAVDATGNASSPVEVVVEGHARPGSSKAGCSMSTHLERSSGWSAGLLLGVALLLRRRPDTAQAR